MKLFQPLLVILSGFLFLLYLRYFRSSFSDRFFALLIWICALMTILFPGITQIFAEMVGVGRGADLFFYLFVVGTSFVGLMLYSKVCAVERLQTMTIRQLACNNAVCVSNKSRDLK